MLPRNVAIEAVEHDRAVYSLTSRHSPRLFYDINLVHAYIYNVIGIFLPYGLYIFISNSKLVVSYTPTSKAGRDL